MPTEADFTVAAARLEGMALRVGELAPILTASANQTGLEGPSLVHWKVDANLQFAVMKLVNAQSEITDTVNSLRNRATICREYVSAMNDYRRALREYHEIPHPGPKPVRPVKPFPWVEE